MASATFSSTVVSVQCPDCFHLFDVKLIIQAPGALTGGVLQVLIGVDHEAFDEEMQRHVVEWHSRSAG